MTRKIQVLSPDGIEIERGKAFYPSMKKAKEAFEKWKNRYSAQGYYSQTCYNGYRRQIPLEQLEDYCEIQIVSN